MRPEFELLQAYILQLFDDVDIDRGFLIRSRDHIELCEHIVESKEETIFLRVAIHFWRKRASLFGVDMSPERGHNLSSHLKNYEFTDADREFLRPYRIGLDPPSEKRKIEIE